MQVKSQSLKVAILLLILVLVAALTMSVTGLLNPLIFWALAGLSAVFAFKILPKIGQ